MKVRGDVESVNLRTGERFQCVVGDGESRLEPLLRPLTASERWCVEEFAKNMRRTVIPKVEKTMRLRAEAAQRMAHNILY